MADVNIPEQEKYNELLRERLELLEKAAGYQGELSFQMTSAISDSTALFRNFLELQDESIVKQEKLIEAETNEKKKQVLEDQKALMETLLEYKKESGIAEDRVREAIEKTESVRQRADQARRKMLADANSDADAAANRARKREVDTKLQINSIGEALRSGLEVGVAAGSGALQLLKGFADSPELMAMSVAMNKFGVNSGVTLTALRAGLAGMAPAIDTNFRSIVKNTGIFSEDLYDNFTFALDPLHAMGEPGLFPEGMERPLVNVGISAQDTGEAMKGLLNNVMLFRPGFMEANKETTVFTANLVAGMKKIGVDIGTSTKALNTFTKSIGQTPMQATKSIKSLLSVSKSLGINVGQAMKDFTGLMPTLAQFGDRAVEVFAELEAQSVATGLAVGELGKLAGRLDTFKGAANAAQAFNAVMGDTLLDVNALVHADPADKISMIQDAMDAAGVSFEDADRRVKQVIASTLNLDVDAAGKLLGGKEDYESISAGIDTAAMSQQDLEAQITSTMTSGEKLQKNLSSTGGAFREFVKKSRVAASQGAKTMFTAFEKGRDQLQSSEQSAMGLLGAMTKLSNISADMANANQGPFGAFKAALEGASALIGIPIEQAITEGLIDAGEAVGVFPEKPETGPTPVEALKANFGTIGAATGNLSESFSPTALGGDAATQGFEGVKEQLRVLNENLQNMGLGNITLSVDGKEITGVVLENMGGATRP
tara:strand:+ start:966 stop:3110 length:2145 start_codon:yes stop_codon:yes gene_type:complete